MTARRMPRKLLPIEQIMAQLASTPSELERKTTGLSDDQLRMRPDENTWSIAEIIAHLRACADMWGDRRILTMVVKDRPTIKTISPITWLKGTNYRAVDVTESLQAFAVQRTKLLYALESLSPNGWTRSATITGAGKPFEVTIHIEGDAIARHERQHIRQIARFDVTIERTD